MSCGVGRRHGSDLALLWLWWRPAATAPIQPLAWEPLYAAGAALEKAKRHTHTKEGTNLRQHLVPEHLASGTVREYMSVVLSLFVVIYSSSRKQMQVAM